MILSKHQAAAAAGWKVPDLRKPSKTAAPKKPSGKSTKVEMTVDSALKADPKNAARHAIHYIKPTVYPLKKKKPVPTMVRIMTNTFAGPIFPQTATNATQPKKAAK